MKSERNVMERGSSSVRSAGSSPVSCTIFDSFPECGGDFRIRIKKIAAFRLFFPWMPPY